MVAGNGRRVARPARAQGPRSGCLVRVTGLSDVQRSLLLPDAPASGGRMAADVARRALNEPWSARVGAWCSLRD